MRRSDRVRAVRLGEAHGADHARDVADDERRTASECDRDAPVEEYVRLRLLRCLRDEQRALWDESESSHQIAKLLNTANPHAEVLYRDAYNRGACTQAQKIIDDLDATN